MSTVSIVFHFPHDRTQCVNVPALSVESGLQKYFLSSKTKQGNSKQNKTKGERKLIILHANARKGIAIGGVCMCVSVSACYFFSHHLIFLNTIMNIKLCMAVENCIYASKRWYRTASSQDSLPTMCCLLNLADHR